MRIAITKWMSLNSNINSFTHINRYFLLLLLEFPLLLGFFRIDYLLPEYLFLCYLVFQ